MKNGYPLAILLLIFFTGCNKNNTTQPVSISLTGAWKLQTAIASTYSKSGVFKATDTLFSLKTNQDAIINFAGDGTFEEYILNNALKINRQEGTYSFDNRTSSLTEILANTNNNPVNNTPGRLRAGFSGNNDLLLSKVKFVDTEQINITYTYYIVNYGPYDGGTSAVVADSVVQVNTLVKQ